MQFTRPLLAVTDGFETRLTALRYCTSMVAMENPKQTGYPRGFLFRGSAPGSQQQDQSPGSVYSIPGPFNPGDYVGTLELDAAGGDSSLFNILEIQAA